MCRLDCNKFLIRLVFFGLLGILQFPITAISALSILLNVLVHALIALDVPPLLTSILLSKPLNFN